MASISNFKAQLSSGGARTNQFRVDITYPSFVTTGIIAGQQGQFLCKAAQLPSSDITNIEMFYRGRPVNFAGERTFAPWTITIYNETSFNIRNAFEQWSHGIQNLNATNGIVNPRDYQVDMSVHQLDRNGAQVKSYKFVDAYPTTISTIQLDYDNPQIEMFDVTFQYNYWTSNTAMSGAFGISTSIDTPVGTFPISV
jgi:hypothetical protein